MMDSKIINNKGTYSLWLATGSQDLYGDKTLEAVAKHSQEIGKALNQSGQLAWPLLVKPTLITSSGISSLMQEANADPLCAGIICWMHTFSPSQMWIDGLTVVAKPILHLHTQFGRDIPWDSIDMDFMNLNQSAHGDREFGHITSRLGLKRAIIAGHWQDKTTQKRIADWSRVAGAVHESRGLRVARFGDNMRDVAVTEGDKVAARIQIGWSIQGHGLADLAKAVAEVSDTQSAALIEHYKKDYTISTEILQDSKQMKRLAYQAKLEIALETILIAGNFKAFTTNFQDLHGLEQLPGLAVQRLMAKGYGFGAEGDWKTAALLRAVKVMGDGLPGGCSFMEDYTYHMEPGNELVLGAHMLEVCPSIASDKPRLEVHQLGIGGKDDPARLVFIASAGDALNASLVGFGNRFRLIVNEVTTVKPPKAMPKLPVAQAVWKVHPDFVSGLEAWLWAGGAHHTAYTTQIDASLLQMWAEAVGIEFVRIGKGSNLESIRSQLVLQELKSISEAKR